MGNCAACSQGNKPRLLSSGNFKSLTVDEFKMFAFIMNYNMSEFNDRDCHSSHTL